MFSVLDIIPIAGILALITAFVRRRAAMKREEAELLGKLDSLKADRRE